MLIFALIIATMLLLLSALSLVIHTQATALRQAEQEAARESASIKMQHYYAQHDHRTIMMDRVAISSPAVPDAHGRFPL
jgi:hypothetical protein